MSDDYNDLMTPFLVLFFMYDSLTGLRGKWLYY
jgi:hypothetical protein